VNSAEEGSISGAEEGWEQINGCHLDDLRIFSSTSLESVRSGTASGPGCGVWGAMGLSSAVEGEDGNDVQYQDGNIEAEETCIIRHGRRLKDLCIGQLGAVRYHKFSWIYHLSFPRRFMGDALGADGVCPPQCVRLKVCSLVPIHRSPEAGTSGSVTQVLSLGD
jgi:hypothetical protein